MELTENKVILAGTTGKLLYSNGYRVWYMPQAACFVLTHKNGESYRRMTFGNIVQLLHEADRDRNDWQEGAYS